MWESFIRLTEGSNFDRNLTILLAILILLAVISLIFHAVKFAIFIIIIGLFLGVTPSMAKNWLNDRMDAENFNLAALTVASDNLYGIPTDWIATKHDGTKYLCKPDLTPDGLGGLNCDDRVFDKIASHQPASDGEFTVEGHERCTKVDYGFKCPIEPTLKLKYQKK